MKFRLRDFNSSEGLHEGQIMELPAVEKMGKKPPLEGASYPQLDLSSYDISHLNLSEYNMQDITFDDRTKWSDSFKKSPKNFAQKEEILQEGKNPGLGIKSLHKKGINGTGVSVAIIDQTLSDHSEYHDNLVHYEEIGYDRDATGSMHGSAVASILVGKTCGVAPKAKLYYFAANNKEKNLDKEGKPVFTALYRAKALERILEINETLPENEKIKIVSLSWGNQSNPNTPYAAVWLKALEKAKSQGVFVMTTASRKEYGLGFVGMGKDACSNSDNISSYSESSFNVPQRFQSDKNIHVPMDHRTTASPIGKDNYAHYALGGWSWSVPWIAGAYALALQVDPQIKPEKFWDLALKTGTYSKKVQGRVIQPKKIITAIQKEKVPKTMLQTLKKCQTKKVFYKMKGKENAK